MITTRAIGIVPSQSRRVLLIIILSILPLVSCSLNFDMPWDKSAADGPQKKTTKTETATPKPGSESQPLPRLSSSTGDDGRKWTRYMTDDDDIRHFVDKDAITQSSKNIVQMWRRREFPPGAPQREIVTLDEIDCRKAQYRTLELRVMYLDGTTGRSNEATRWVKIYANSSEEYLMNEHCK